MVFDVIIIGGSYAGLQAALTLGRSLRTVLVIDNNRPCNRQTPHSHNFLTHDGGRPLDILNTARTQVQQYDTVQMIDGKVIEALKSDHFTVTLENQESFKAKKLLFATGIKDLLPAIAGLADCWGISILHCPYCHGFEVAGKEWGVIAGGDVLDHFMVLLPQWTTKLLIFSNGSDNISKKQRETAEKKGIKIIDTPISSFVHQDGHLQEVNLTDGSSYKLSTLFMKPPFEQHSEVPASLGCAFTEQGYIKTDDLQRSSVKGVYAAGDNAAPLRALAAAVSMGLKAGAAINIDLLTEDAALH